MELSDKWTLWFHSLTDKNWLDNSYIKLYEIETIGDFWTVFNNFGYIHEGMFFLMRKHIFPLWEKPENIDGGTWSVSVPKLIASDIMLELSMALLGETLVDNMNMMSEINGISITPKYNSSVIKIWNKTSENSNKFVFNNDFKINWSDFFYKENRQRINNIKKPKDF